MEAYTLLLLGCDSVAYECEKLVLLHPCPVTHVALDPNRRPDRAAACNLWVMDERRLQQILHADLNTTSWTATPRRNPCNSEKQCTCTMRPHGRSTLRVQAAVDPNLPRRRFHKPNPSHAFLYPMPSLCAAPKPKQKGTKVASTRLLLQMITRAGELHQMLILANNIPGGVRWCFGGGVWEDSWRDIGSGDVLEVGCGKIHGGISCLSSVVSLDVF